MGVYNTINFRNNKGEELSIQSKNGDVNMNSYEIGNEIEIPNGIYFTQDGSFVVYLGKIVAAFDVEEQHLFDKWDRPLEYPDLQAVNPIKQMMDKIFNQ